MFKKQALLAGLLVVLAFSFAASARGQGKADDSRPKTQTATPGATGSAAVLPPQWGIAPISAVPVQSLSSMVKIVLGLGVLSALLTAGAVVYAVLGWKNSYWSIAGRAHYTLVTVAAVAFVWFLNYWNLLDWRYQLASVTRLAGRLSLPASRELRKG